MILEINGLDISNYLKSYKPYPNTMVTNEGRNAKGTMSFDIVAKKVKIETTIWELPAAKARQILNAVNSYKATCRFLDIRTGTIKTISAYVPDPQPNYKVVGGTPWCEEFTLNIIEM